MGKREKHRIGHRHRSYPEDGNWTDSELDSIVGVFPGFPTEARPFVAAQLSSILQLANIDRNVAGKPPPSEIRDTFGSIQRAAVALLELLFAGRGQIGRPFSTGGVDRMADAISGPLMAGINRHLLANWEAAKGSPAALPAHLRDLPPRLWSTTLGERQTFDESQRIDQFLDMLRLIARVSEEAAAEAARDVKPSAIKGRKPEAGEVASLIWLLVDLQRDLHERLPDRVRKPAYSETGQTMRFIRCVWPVLQLRLPRLAPATPGALRRVMDLRKSSPISG